MPRWTVESPTTLDFDRVAALRVRAIAGSVAVLSTDDRPCLDIDHVSGQPLLVSHSDGVLTVSYEDLTWEGLLGWLRPQRHSAAITVTVPTDCPVQLGVVTAGAIVSGIAAKTSVKSVSGNITLDGVTGTVDATTVSGDIEAQGIGGEVGLQFGVRRSHPGRRLGGPAGRQDASAGGSPRTSTWSRDGQLRVGTVSGAVAIRLPGHRRPGRAAVHRGPGAERVRWPGILPPPRAPTC